MSESKTDGPTHEITSIDQIPKDIIRQIELPVFREGVEFAKEAVAKVTAKYQEKLDDLERRLGGAQEQSDKKHVEGQRFAMGNREGDFKIINLLDASDSSVIPDELDKLPTPSSRLMASLINEMKTRLSRDDRVDLGNRLRSIIGRESITPGEILSTGWLAGYEVKKHIASGDHGDVYLATDPNGNRRILKVGKKNQGQTDVDVRNKIAGESEVISC